ncbi:alkylation response protein AidB-like acyl-CoA dehydrogenase [Rhodoligotrophos appendicifer]|uniref:acyl-CoA dehydrogenase family protein n=1 Tax=Rhodoligotrophos appendicifer TaxID=987056 RepID=UPI0011866571|nr:acyl-CoA dehydrogenase family protein [Rhodoligotrophos appendicifer]
MSDVMDLSAAPKAYREEVSRRVLKELCHVFAERAEEHDDNGRVVLQNFSELKRAGLLGLAVPRSVAGGGADYDTLCKVISDIARSCGSTALTLAMHLHQSVILNCYRHQNRDIQHILEQVSSKALMLASSGGADGLNASGRAVKVRDGYIVNARKKGVSGAELADVLMTSAVLESESENIIHFSVPMHQASVRIHQNWNAMGMRGTGSQEIILKDLFVPSGAIYERRTKGAWSHINHLTAMYAFPLIYAAYLGIAQAARDRVVAMGARFAADQYKTIMVGTLDTALHAAHIAHQDMISAAVNTAPSLETTNRIMMGRSLVGREVLNVVEIALDTVGGTSFQRGNPLERFFRDAQAARFHPLSEKQQQLLSGRLALNLDCS